ncbi:MAG: DoxX family protein [Nitrospinota bacterium]|nr:DoxX family protein [Nitrospinota bacterium]
MRALISGRGYTFVRLILGGIFLAAGVLKLMDTESFAIIIGAYGIIPDSWLRPVSICLPLLEMGAAVGLLLDYRGSLAGVLAMLLIFIAVLGYGVYLGLDVDCGCFGPEDKEGQAYSGLRDALYRDAVMAGAVFYLYICRLLLRIEPVSWLGDYEMKHQS